MISYKEVEGIFATLKDRAADDDCRGVLDLIFTRYAYSREFCEIVAEQLGVDAEEFSKAFTLYLQTKLRPHRGFTDADQNMLGNFVWNERGYSYLLPYLKFK